VIPITTKRSDLKNLTQTADTWLRQQGFGDKALNLLTQSCRRLLATSLQAEFNQLGTLPPNERGKVSTDVINIVRSAVEDLGNMVEQDPKSGNGVKALARELEHTTQSSETVHQILRGLRTTLLAAHREKRRKAAA